MIVEGIRCIVLSVFVCTTKENIKSTTLPSERTGKEKKHKKDFFVNDCVTEYLIFSL